MANPKIGSFRNAHRNEPVLILGNGPSLCTVNFERLKVETIGIHRSWKKWLSPYHIIGQHHSYFDELRNGEWKPPGIIFTRGLQGAGWSNVCKLKFLGIKPYLVSLDLEKGTHTTFVGQLAIEIAIWMGYDPIYLIGYDLNYREEHFDEPKVKAEDKEFDKTPRVAYFPDDGTRDVQRKMLSMLAMESPSEIINLNWKSAVDAFPFKDLEEVYV